MRREIVRRQLPKAIAIPIPIARVNGLMNFIQVIYEIKEMNFRYRDRSFSAYVLSMMIGGLHGVQS
jgi:hypothetical protein